FGASAPRMHLAFVLLGTLNAWLLAHALVRSGVPSRGAAIAAIVFTLTPFVVYVHGWTGTLADLLTLGLGLAAFCAVRRSLETAHRGESAASAITSGLLVAAALLSKESAVVLPARLLLAIPKGTSPGKAAAAIVPASMIAIAYLAIRLPVLAHSAQIDSAYAWSIAHVPARFADYLLFPFVPPLLEVGPLLTKSPARLAAATACAATLLLALATTGWRRPIVWLGAYAIALAPVLVLGTAYNQYAYLASAAGVGLVAAAWSSLRPLARNVTLALAAIAIAHGIAVMSRMQAIGTIQRHLGDDLLAALRESTAPLYIAAADPRDAWLPARLLRGVDAYRGTKFSGRVHLGEPPEGADGQLLRMTRNGHLLAQSPALTPD
ncbi:MAG TPA: hypothetical protein VHE32_02950, partial [Rhodanobacteraceae bacterium]|nr:hypothetical protein [Rhodanobacteraceae bacterium]